MFRSSGKTADITGISEREGYNLHRIAVERNEKIEAKEDYATIILQDSDVIEIVSFMGGGAC
ncbi:MAG: sulfur carrier protein ThiS [Ruminococcus callidus]